MARAHFEHGAIALAIAALVTGGGIFGARETLRPQIERHTVRTVEQVQHEVNACKHAWPDLTDDQKAKLATAIKDIGASILIMNADGCGADLAEDIDDAAEAAGVASVLDRPAGPVGYGMVVQGEHADGRAAQLAAALHDVTGIDVGTQEGQTVLLYPLFVVIGKHSVR